MTRMRFAYGTSGLEVDIPERNLLAEVHMHPVAPLEDEAAAIQDALENPIGSAPLSSIAKGRKSACIVISDFTRPIPNGRILAPILKTIEEAGVPRDAITILIATGIHTPTEGQLLIDLVGQEIHDNYRIANHLSEDPSTNRNIGDVDGIPIELDVTYLDADLKILTGLVELHLMAGYSGGRKSVLPGVASLNTMKHLHGYRMIQAEGTQNATLEGNPFHQAAVKVARIAGADFICNVTLDENRRLTGVFAGDLEAAHKAASQLVASSAVVTVPELADIVMTCGGGEPLDRSFYQSIKGVAGSLGAIKQGGTIVLAARNADGAGTDAFADLLDRLQTHMDFYDIVVGPNYVQKDQWMIQELCNGLHRADIIYITEGLTAEQVRKYLMTPAATLDEALAIALERQGAAAKILAIPEGPYVLPRLDPPVRGLYDWHQAA